MNLVLVSSERVRDSYLAACRLDLMAVKPGNVSLDVPGHGMTADDFQRSADASAPILGAGGFGLGERIRRATEATRSRVGCNTNLGILLLCAPLAQAGLEPVAREFGKCKLRQRLEGVLASADRDEAELVFAAIRLAAPGGLGTSRQHDVMAPAQVGLREAMAEAASRDHIARQYATGFEDLFSIALPALRAARSRTLDDSRAATDLFLTLLARFPDSHIQRRHGERIALRVSTEADAAYKAWLSDPPAAGQTRLRLLDARFKDAGINPGTTADLTVATLFLDRLLAAADEIAGDERRQPTRFSSLHFGAAPLISTLMI